MHIVLKLKAVRKAVDFFAFSATKIVCHSHGNKTGEQPDSGQN